MKKWTVLGLALAALLGCSDGLVSPDPGDQSFAKGGVPGGGGGGGGGGDDGGADPTATFTFPTSGFGLMAVGDPAYTHGVCGVDTRIFVGGSGDATVNTGNPRSKDRSCADYPRRIAIDLDGNGSEDTSAVFLNTFGIHNAGYYIPVGQTAQHSLGMGACGENLRFSDELRDGTLVDGRKVFVTRQAADQWLVQTDDPSTPEVEIGRAHCSATGASHDISVSFTIKSSRPLDPQ